MLSLVLSIAIVPLIGIILNFVRDISLETVLYTNTAFIFLASIVAWIRQHRLPRQKRLGTRLYLTRSWFAKVIGEGVQSRVIAGVLVVALLGSLGLLFHTIQSPRLSESFTQFYILGTEGKFADYPSEFRVGQEAKIPVRIVNHEGKEVTYRVGLVIEDRKLIETPSIILADKEEWRGEVVFVPDQAGVHQKLELMLYQDNEAKSRLDPLQLWVDIREKSEAGID